MSFVRWSLGFVGIVLLIFFGVAFVLPSKFQVERSRELQAPPLVVYETLVDLKRWSSWDPWYDEDPQMSLSYGDVSRGEGASFSWSSETMGSGTLELVHTDPARSIDCQIYFNGQTARPTRSRFELEPLDGGGTRVIWSFSGQLGYPVERYVGLLLDRMVGASLDRGLEKLDAVTAAGAAVTPGANR